MPYADDLLVIAGSEQELVWKLNRWKDGLEKKGTKSTVQGTSVIGLQFSSAVRVSAVMSIHINNNNNNKLM